MSMQIATYNGRKYKLAWSGKTKYGERAKLQFFDGSKEFWVDLSKVTITASSSAPRSYGFSQTAYDRNCWDCRDARRAGKEACKQCMFDEYDC